VFSHRIGAVFVIALATGLALALGVIPTRMASAIPPCTENSCPTDPAPEPEPPGPVIRRESVSYTLTVDTARGKVSDGSGLDCPGTCSRKITYTRTCTDDECPAYAYSTITLMLTAVDGYTATWDGCTPRLDASRCDVTVDSDRTVRVVWAERPDGPPIAPKPLSDGSPLAPGGGNSAATTVGGTVETSVEAKRGVIRSTIRYAYRRAETWTEFTLFKVRHLPTGATVHADCSGARCPKAAVIAAKRRALVLDRLTHRRFAAGTVITVRVSKAGKRPRTTQIRIRRGKDPLITHPRKA
jgi:hypothetical protein